jgi:hypothetical protein
MSDVIQLFSSPKCHGTIPYVDEMWADALIQTHLDPNVYAMKSAPGFETPDAPRMPNTILVLRREGLFELRVRRSVEETRSKIAELPDSEHRAWILKEEDVLASPRKENAREIWASRGFRMSVHLRMSVLDEVRHRSVAFSELVARLEAFAHADQAVLHLAWIGALQFEVGRHLIGPSTLVSATGS